MKWPRELPLAREQYGFQRTSCGCAFCQAPCRHMPGSLDVADLTRLCPPTENIFSWAEHHLRALTDKSYPTLVPARQENGRCHWLLDGGCVVHDKAPYSCAFFDMHMTSDEIDRRSAATIQARQEDAVRNGLYRQVWIHLCRQGLMGIPGDRAALAEELQKIRDKNNEIS
jgi:hypothetical protein